MVAVAVFLTTGDGVFCPADVPAAAATGHPLMMVVGLARRVGADGAATAAMPPPEAGGVPDAEAPAQAPQLLEGRDVRAYKIISAPHSL